MAKTVPADNSPRGSGSRIERLATGELQLDPRNARLHGPRNLEAMQASLERFGQQRPIVVSADGVVLAGNATLQAARALGWTHIDAVRTSLADAEAVAYAVADNRTAELAEWDAAVLGKLAQEVDLAPYFTEGELQAVIGTWELPEAELERLEAQLEPAAAPATITVRCDEADREAVADAVRAAVAPFAGAVVE